MMLMMLAPGYASIDEINKLCEAIWPASYAAEAAKASIEDGLCNSTGQVFLIRDFSGNSIGLTGYFDVDTKAGVAYLRWTGVLPEYRKNGIFKQAIKLLTTQLKGANPNINALIELVPDNEYGHSIVGAFERVGFDYDAERDVVIPTGEDDTWPVLPYVLAL
jgi:GNAT superfamily N-acetyltransferase